MVTPAAVTVTVNVGEVTLVVVSFAVNIGPCRRLRKVTEQLPPLKAPEVGVMPTVPVNVAVSVARRRWLDR